MVVTKISRAFISRGITRIGNVFGYSLLDRSRIILGESGDGNEWMWMRTSRVEVACMSERASES